MNFVRKSLNSLVKLQQMFRIEEIELGMENTIGITLETCVGVQSAILHVCQLGCGDIDMAANWYGFATACYRQPYMLTLLSCYAQPAVTKGDIDRFLSCPETLNCRHWVSRDLLHNTNRWANLYLELDGNGCLHISLGRSYVSSLSVSRQPPCVPPWLLSLWILDRSAGHLPLGRKKGGWLKEYRMNSGIVK